MKSGVETGLGHVIPVLVLVQNMSTDMRETLARGELVTKFKEFDGNQQQKTVIDLTTQEEIIVGRNGIYHL